MILISELGADHKLVQKNCDLSRILDEMFKCSSAQMETFSNLAVMSNMARRHLVLNEIDWHPDLHVKALDLPRDKKGEHLFWQLYR